MQIQPRHEILQVWKALADHSQPVGSTWSSPGGEDSVGDAERLLCLLAPATEIEYLRLDQPNLTARDALAALRPLGDNIEIPKLVLRLLGDYLDTYTTEDGTPVFSGGVRFASPDSSGDLTPEQRGLDVVDSFSVSVALMLAALDFLQEFGRSLTRIDLIKELGEVRARAEHRLTAAMVGLMRSFAVNVFTEDSNFGREQLRRVNQDRIPARQIVEELRSSMLDIHTRLRDGNLAGAGSDDTGLENANRLFECGWSWSIVRGAAPMAKYEIGAQPVGVAEQAPYLYFTVVALEAIELLIAERTRLHGLLTPAQAELADGLRIRLELTRSFWAGLATFGSGDRWPLEDLPWRTTDGLVRGYYSLLIGGIVVQELAGDSAAHQRDLVRVGEVFDKLARRVRITEGADEDDEAVLRAHGPGVKEPLRVSGGEAPAAWLVSDIAPLLLKRTLQLEGLLSDGDAQDRMRSLSQDIWRHLRDRRWGSGSGAAGLWDDPARVFAGLVEQPDGLSWPYTRRVVDCLIVAGRLVSGRPPESPHLRRTATEMLREADHLLQSELWRGTGLLSLELAEDLEGIGVALRRAHAVLAEKPATAVALTQDALRGLDGLSAARAANRGTT